MSLFIVLIATSTLLAAGSARVAVGTFTDGHPGDELDMRCNFNYPVNAGPMRSAGKEGNFTSGNTSGAILTANNSIRIGNKGCGAALPVTMPSSPYAAK